MVQAHQHYKFRRTVGMDTAVALGSRTNVSEMIELLEVIKSTLFEAIAQRLS